MPLLLPVIAISRSQNIRIGTQFVSSPNNLSTTTAGTNAQTGAPFVPTWVDLLDGRSRKDLEHHLAIGAVLVVGAAATTSSSYSTTAALTAGTAVSAGADVEVNVSAAAVTTNFGFSVTTVAQTNHVVTGSAVAGTVNTRIVLAQINPSTGVVTYVLGTPSASPVAPSAAAGQIPFYTFKVVTDTATGATSITKVLP